MINCTYFVEGCCEKKLLDALKSSPALIRPGKIKVFNVIQDELKTSHLLSIKDGYVVFVFDTDTYKTSCLLSNIEKVRDICPKKVKLLFLAQVPNFEQELIRSTDIKTVSQLTRSKSNKDFKADFIDLKDCRVVLSKHNFDIKKIWSSKVPAIFASMVTQGASKIIIN